MSRKCYFSAANRISASLLCGLLAGCGSSDNASPESSQAPFVAPTTTNALNALLVNRFADASDFDLWQCSLNGAQDATIAYRLTADQQGVEYDLQNDNNEFGFVWETLSSDSLRATATANNAVSAIDNIIFASRDEMSFTLNQSDSLRCMRDNNQVLNDAPQNPPASTPGDNSLNYGGQLYALTHGLDEQFAFRPVTGNDTHRSGQLNVANGEFFSTLIAVGLVDTLIWRPRDATVWLRADLHTPGADDFTNARFSYVMDSVDEDGAAVAGLNFFNDARFGVDINNDGDIESEDGEFLDVVGGTIDVSKAGGISTISFELLLENGVTVTGNFRGNVIVVPPQGLG